VVGTHRRTDLARVLGAAAASTPLDAITEVARELGLAFDAEAVSFLIADLSGRALVRMAHVPLLGDHNGTPVPLAAGERREDEESATVLPFDGGPEEQTVRAQTVRVIAPDASRRSEVAGRWRVLAPVTERGEAIGLLELYLPDEPGRDVVNEIAQVAHLLAYVVIANRRHTDLFEWGQRSRAFSLSAEIQQRLLPPARTCEASAFTLSGWLEPAASIGGDTFDYSLSRDLLHLSLTDAMGHGVGAALTASVCLGGLRGARRRGTSLLAQADEANRALVEHALNCGGDDFAAGVIGRVDLRTGSVELVNAGHVAPYLLRGSTVTALDLPVDLPFGMFADSRYRSSSLVLEPEDRLVLVTDGMLERNVASVDVPGAIKETRDLHPREVVRALADSALAAAGHALQDDATVLCLDWHGSHEETRVSDAGADPSRASAPLAQD
jgi:serine phosphatase RsbU (regulator of sigma subunit)